MSKYVFVCVCAFVHVSGSWVPKVDARYLPQSLPTSCFEAGSLTEPEAQ